MAQPVEGAAFMRGEVQSGNQSEQTGEELQQYHSQLLEEKDIEALVQKEELGNKTAELVQFLRPRDFAVLLVPHGEFF